MEKTFVLCSVAFIGATLSTPLLAADSENYWMNTDRGSIAVGAFFVDESTEIRVSSSTPGTGAHISFQDDRGLGDRDELDWEYDGFFGYTRFNF